MNKDKSVDTSHLPQGEVFKQKESNQYKQLADTGKPVEENEKPGKNLHGKQQNRTSKEEGLNQEKSGGNAGSFEGVEDAEKK